MDRTGISQRKTSILYSLSCAEFRLKSKSDTNVIHCLKWEPMGRKKVKGEGEVA
jgi:hypothetical protein